MADNIELVRGVPRENIIPVAVAAKQIGMKVYTLECWIRQEQDAGRRHPFGVYIKKEGRTHGGYTIFRTRFERYMAGLDVGQAADQAG